MRLEEDKKPIVNNRPPREGNKAACKNEGKHATKRRAFPSRNCYKVVLIVMALIAICFMVTLILVDTFPVDLTLLLVSLMFVMLIGSCMLLASRKKIKRIIGMMLALIFAFVFITATGFMGDTYAMLSKISDSGINATGPTAKSVDVTKKPFNIYITGIDQWAKEKGLDLERSDVNMLVTINPETKDVLLTSIPRDTYVKLHTAQQMDKLTHTGVYGVDETLNTVQDWLGIDINYYVKMNFTGARDVIDAMGGIDVYSPVEFRSSIMGYQYVKGWNHLRGKKAIYYARERKSFEGQDAIRVENQQRVMKAVIKKMTSSTTLLTRYGDIMDAAGDNLQTNMPTSDMRDIVKMQITELAQWNVDTQKIEGEYDQDYVASLTQSMKFDIYRPSDESVKSCVEKINNTMKRSKDEDAPLQERSRSFLINAIKRITTKEEEKNKDVDPQ